MFSSFDPRLLRSAYELYSTDKGRDDLTRRCEAEVVEWRWASGDMAFAFSLRKPFVKELHHSTPKWLKPDAKPKEGYVKHGSDGLGAIRVVFQPWFSEGAMKGGEGEWTYLVYEESQTDAVKYHGVPGQLFSVRRCVYVDGHLVREHILRGDGATESHYQWEGTRLERILTMGWSHRFNYLSSSPDWEKVEVVSRREERFEYDSLGRVGRIIQRRVNEDGTDCRGIPSKTVYERPKKQESLPSLANEIERMLLDQIPAAIAKGDATFFREVERPVEGATKGEREVRFEPVSAVIGKGEWKGPFCCLLLFYCGEDFPAGWPPVVMLKREAERQRFLAGDKDRREGFWASDERRNLTVNLCDEVLNNSCRLHLQLMEARHADVSSEEQTKIYASAKKVLRNVAKALNDVDWSKMIEVTPDFFVAALDDHYETEYVKDLKPVVPAATFQALKRQGLF